MSYICATVSRDWFSPSRHKTSGLVYATSCRCISPAVIFGQRPFESQGPLGKKTWPPVQSHARVYRATRPLHTVLHLQTHPTRQATCFPKIIELKVLYTPPNVKQSPRPFRSVFTRRRCSGSSALEQSCSPSFTQQSRSSHSRPRCAKKQLRMSEISRERPNRRMG